MNRRRNPLDDMLNDPNKQVNKTYGDVGSLARLFRTMLKDLNISGYQFAILMNKFLTDPRNHIPDNKRDQTSNRGNLNKEFQKGTMTWKVFCKAMRFLQVLRFRIIIEADRSNGVTTRHSVEVNLELNEPGDADFEDEFGDQPPREDMPEIPYLDFDPDKN